jgi:hypothetical protein
MIDPFSLPGAALFAGAALAVGVVMHVRLNRDRQAGRDHLARWLGSGHQHLVNEDRADLGLDQLPHQFANRNSGVQSIVHNGSDL